MTSKLKCPFCETELEQGIELWRGGHILGCPKCKRNADDIFWFALIQAKQDLAIATKANDEIRGEYETYHGAEREGCFTIDWEVVAKKMYNYANNALKQIEHKEI